RALHRRGSDAVQPGEQAGDAHQGVDHEAIEECVQMTAVERPTVEPELKALGEQFIEMLAGWGKMASSGGVHLVIVVEHGGGTQELQCADGGVSQDMEDGDPGAAESDFD